MSSSGGGGGANNNSTSASIAISATRMGAFSVAMSTSFQPAEWDDQFFLLNPSATRPLGNLGPHHIRLQGVSQGVPQTSASTWDFTILDDITQPVLAVGDRSPEFQIAVAPAFLYDSSHNLDLQQFAAYTQNLVRYHNVPAGFTAPDGQHASPSGIPITGWGIYNEPNFNHLDSTQYTQLYNTVVPPMQAVDFDKGGGISACNGTTFVTDLRGSSPFFAAWRPCVFSQLGQAGAEALYHWDFGADQQYGEVDYNTGAFELSYWVDYWLGQAFPPTAGSRVLQFTSSESAGLETLPVINSDGSVVVMVANHAVNP